MPKPSTQVSGVSSSQKSESTACSSCVFARTPDIGREVAYELKHDAIMKPFGLADTSRAAAVV